MAICAGCNALAPWGAAIVGVVSGVVYVVWSYAVCKLKIDDPLDAVAGKDEPKVTEVERSCFIQRLKN